MHIVHYTSWLHVRITFRRHVDDMAVTSNFGLRLIALYIFEDHWMAFSYRIRQVPVITENRQITECVYIEKAYRSGKLKIDRRFGVWISDWAFDLHSWLPEWTRSADFSREQETSSKLLYRVDKRLSSSVVSNHWLLTEWKPEAISSGSRHRLEVVCSTDSVKVFNLKMGRYSPPRLFSGCESHSDQRHRFGKIRWEWPTVSGVKTAWRQR